MQIQTDSDSSLPGKPLPSLTSDPALRAIAYSMDALIPGLYIWFGKVRIRFGGSQAESTYPGTIHSHTGLAIVLPGYRICTTYQGSYDPR